MEIVVNGFLNLLWMADFNSPEQSYPVHKTLATRENIPEAFEKGKMDWIMFCKPNK